MSSHLAVAHPDTAPLSRRIAFLRAVAALVWAAALAITAGNADLELSTGLALLVTAYPLIPSSRRSPRPPKAERPRTGCGSTPP